MGRRTALWRSACLGMVLAITACAGDSDAPQTPTIPTAGPPPATIDLPEPRTVGPVSLEEAIAGRRSLREYTSEPLSEGDLSQLLWAAQGLTQEGGAGRAAPSAGGTYPLELYVVSPGGLFHYLPDGHLLEQLGHEDLREPLAAAALDQEHVADGAVVIVMTADFLRTEERYGDRADRYVKLEAGHAAQNLLLQAVALDLGAVPVGAFRDEEVRDLLDLPERRTPLYLIPIGHPADS